MCWLSLTRVPKSLRRVNAMSNKELIIDAVKDLPDSASLDEILEHLAILAAICQGQEDAKAGRVISHEEMKKQVASWTGK